jgi:uroporphyrin-III C-methyltransferase/precorrin-2 dehydrogenase/sirohydrochlorin ferrochelatase
MADGPAIIFVGEAVAHGDWSGAAELAARNYGVA